MCIYGDGNVARKVLMKSVPLDKRAMKEDKRVLSVRREERRGMRADGAYPSRRGC